MKIRLKECQLCGHGDFIGLLLDVKDDPYKAGAGIDWDVEWSLCTNCSFLFQNPRVDQTTQESFYQKSGYRLEGISQGYIDSAPGALLRFHPWLMANGLDLIQLRGSTCFEYGCGIGGALDFLGKLQNTVYGVEIDEMLADYGNSHYSVKIVKTINDLPQGLKYDFIFTHNAVEHVYDPNEFFEYAGRTLKPSGIVAIVLPGWRFSTSQITIEEFNSSHNSMWDHVSLSKFMNKYGIYMTSFLYTNAGHNPRGSSEIFALGIKSDQKNYYEFTTDEVLYELRKAISTRHNERIRELTRPRKELAAVINQGLALPQ